MGGTIPQSVDSDTGESLKSEGQTANPTAADR
jgi:hypothetical protein